MEDWPAQKYALAWHAAGHYLSDDPRNTASQGRKEGTSLDTDEEEEEDSFDIKVERKYMTSDFNI